MVEQVYTAAKICVRGTILEDQDKQLKTISNSVGCGHESLLEHTNLITILEEEYTDDKDHTKKLTQFLETLRYLNYRVYYKEQSMVIIISGSIRGYKHIVRNITDLTNPYLEAIKLSMYKTPKCFYKDFINDKILEEKDFVKFEYMNDRNRVFIDENDDADVVIGKSKSSKGYPKILYRDDILILGEEILRLTGIDIDFEDLLDFSTITVLFKMSRTAANQLVRHRNGISQESQRYVSYSDTPFINPLADLDDPKYDQARKYMDTWAEEAVSNYSYLLRNYPNVVKKEDARSILPSNMETRVLMTFTYKSLIQAIELRTAKAAQREIRTNFIKLEKDLKGILFGDKDSDLDLEHYIWTLNNHLYRSNSKIDVSGLETTIGNKYNEFDELMSEDIVSEADKAAAKKEIESKLGEYPYPVEKKVSNFVKIDTEYNDI